MPSHLHLKIRDREKASLATTFRDFKKFTSDEIVKSIITITIIVMVIILGLLIWHSIELHQIRGHL